MIEGKISIVIATKNEELNIQSCIRSIKKQSYRNYEIIVIDNGSTDQTEAIVKSENIYFLSLKSAITSFPKNFRGAQINLGVSIATGAHIFIPDADMTIEEGFFEEAIELLRNYDALYSPEEIKGKSHFSKIRNFERSFYVGTCLDVPRIFNRNLFEGIDGFDEVNIRFGYDDWDFSKKIKIAKFKVGIMQKRIFHDETRLSVISYLKKKNNYIKDCDSYIKKWGSDDLDISRQFGIRYRFFTVFFEEKKWKKILKNPAKSAAMYCLRFLVGLFYLLKRINA